MTIYEKLCDRFRHIEAAINPELQSELDGLLSDIADEMAQMKVLFERGIVKALTNQKLSHAGAVCHLCAEGVSRRTENGREVHHDGSVVIRCSANSIWAEDTGLIPRVFKEGS